MGAPPSVAPYDSPNLTDGAATTNRLTGGTGTFAAGKVSEDGLVDDLGWAGNNYTELLYSITFKQADLANGDTIRFRVLRNGATTGLTYTQTPTVTIAKGGGGPVTPVASFTSSVTTVTAGSTVTFTDTSTNTPTTWAWNFGTGASPATAATQGPHTVTFSTAGTSTVNLTAGNTAGSDAADPTNITVNAAPTVAITQAAYGFYADDGSDTGSSPAVAQDTPLAINVTASDVQGHVRFLVQSTNAVTVPTTTDLQLQWEKNASGTWTNVTTSSSTVAGFNSISLVDTQDVTSSRLTGGTGTPSLGRVSETGSDHGPRLGSQWVHRDPVHDLDEAGRSRQRRHAQVPRAAEWRDDWHDLHEDPDSHGHQDRRSCGDGPRNIRLSNVALARSFTR